MRASQVPALATALLVLGLASCGYVGPVLPPSPRLPQSVTNLVAVERGDKIVIDFSTPPRTTDNIPITRFSDIDLRVGPAAIPFDFDTWADSATRYPVQPPPLGDPDDPVPESLSKTIPAASWVGKRVAVAVRTSIRKKDHYSSWSNRVVLEVVPPLAPPVVQWKSTAKGVSLSWQAEGRNLEYRIYRQGSNDTHSTQVGTSKTPDYLDTTSQYDTPYKYSVVAVEGLAESLPSEVVDVETKDTFAPSIPANLTALAAPASIELSWQRSPESDLKGYFVYRSVDNGPYERVGGLLTLPDFSDRHAERGKTYRYRVSAVDQKNNESEKSAPVTVAY